MQYLLKIGTVSVTLNFANIPFNFQVQVESKNFFGVSRLSKPVLFKTYKSGKKKAKQFMRYVNLIHFSNHDNDSNSYTELKTFRHVVSLIFNAWSRYPIWALTIWGQVLVLLIKFIHGWDDNQGGYPIGITWIRLMVDTKIIIFKYFILFRNWYNCGHKWGTL